MTKGEPQAESWQQLFASLTGDATVDAAMIREFCDLHEVAPAQAAETIARSRRRPGLGAKMPGVSTKMICAPSWIAMPSTRRRVVCTLGETIETFAPTSPLSSVDLPELGAPMSAT